MFSSSPQLKHKWYWSPYLFLSTVLTGRYVSSANAHVDPSDASCHLHNVVLSCTGAHNAQDVGDALSTLAVTNLGYCVTTLVLAFKSPPELTLYEWAVVTQILEPQTNISLSALVVIYLTCFILGFVYAITIRYARTKGFHRHIYWMVVIQCYFVLCTFLTVCITMPKFGSDAACNYERNVSVFFVRISMSQFRMTGLIICHVILLLGTGSIVFNNFVRKDQT